MTGIFLLIIVALWAWACLAMTRALSRKVPSMGWRLVIAPAVFVVLLALPLIDEIVGGKQFEQLCKENSTIQVNRETAAGKTVYFAPEPDFEIKGAWVRIVLRPRRFIDASTGETVVSYNELMATGGWLTRALAISEGGMPLTFRGTCVPENRPGSIETFKPLGINYIEPPINEH